MLYVPNSVRSDSVKIAGLMDLYNVQGRWSDAARLGDKSFDPHHRALFESMFQDYGAVLNMDVLQQKAQKVQAALAAPFCNYCRKVSASRCDAHAM